MSWETPAFEEIRMDAEIGSYQEDPGPAEGPFYALPAQGEAPSAAANESR